MNKEMTEIAHRAVAAVPLKRWPDGFIAVNKKTGKPLGRVHKLTSGGGLIVREMPWKMVSHLYLPDLSDPATLGCLLHLVREVCAPAKFREAVGRCFGIHARGKRSMMDDRGIAVECLVAALKAGANQ